MSISDMIRAAVENKPNDFSTIVKDELNARIMDEIESRRIEVATSIFAKDVEEIDMGSNDPRVEAELDQSDDTEE